MGGDAGGGNMPGSGSAGRTGGSDDIDYTNDTDIQYGDESGVYGGGARKASEDIENSDDLQSQGTNHPKKGNASPNVDSGPINNDRGA